MKVKYLSCFTRDFSPYIFKADPTEGGGVLVIEEGGLME